LRMIGDPDDAHAAFDADVFVALGVARSHQPPLK
jgi:hypothetical protein